MALSSYGTPMGKVLGIRGDVREGRGGQPDRLGKVRGEKRGGRLRGMKMTSVPV